MRSAWQALQIMWSLHHDLGSGEKSSFSHFIDLNGEEVEVDVYEPHIKSIATIVVIHGMSPFGKEDRRIVVFCQALCQLGFRVVAPDVQSIRELKIESQQVSLVADILLAVSDSPLYCPTGKLSVLAPSFSGAICLAAASSSKLVDRVQAVCAIGAFTEVESVMDYLLSAQSADPYGRYIVLKKIIPLVGHRELSEKCELIQAVLDAAIADNIHETTTLDLDNKAAPGSAIALRKTMQSMSDSERQLVDQVLHDTEFRRELFASARESMREELEALDIVQRLGSLSARVLLLHGQQDKVIPYSQSELLFNHLRQTNKHSKIVVTPFLSHGDTQFSLGMVKDVMKLVRGFAFFFDELQHEKTA